MVVTLLVLLMHEGMSATFLLSVSININFLFTQGKAYAYELRAKNINSTRRY